jgi:integrase
MAIRKREWTTKGETKEAWIVEYRDAKKKKHIKTFERKKDAELWAAKTKIDVKDGLHTPDGNTVTVAEAGELWIEGRRKAGIEPTTLEQYRIILDRHIKPFIGHMKLTQLTTAKIRTFEERLADGDQPDPGNKIRNRLAGMMNHKHIKTAEKDAAREALDKLGRSRSRIKDIMVKLNQLLADAVEREFLKVNPCRQLMKGRWSHAREDRGGKLQVGVDIPTNDEIRRLVDALINPESRRGSDGHRQFLPILVAIFTGLRASEIRGLCWDDINLDKSELYVRQRADMYKKLGKPKSWAGQRTVPLTPMLVSRLREWKLACPKGELNLVFPTRSGTVQSYSNLVMSGLEPAQVACGLAWPRKDADGEVVTGTRGQTLYDAKYPGMHALRHWYASWLINRKADGGLELPLKMVSTRMGHKSITITLDTYGHLFPSDDTGAELAAAEERLLARLNDPRLPKPGPKVVGIRNKKPEASGVA